VTRILTPRFPDKRAPEKAAEFVRTGRAAKRRKQLERQRERETRTRVFLERSSRAFIAFDESGRVLDWNVRAAALFGWQTGARARPALTAALTRKSWRALEEALAAWPVATESRRVELEARAPGGVVPVEFGISRLFAGASAEFAALVEDLSARRRAELAAELVCAAAAALASTPDPFEAAGRLLDAVLAGLGADFAAVWILDPAARRIRYFAGRVAADGGAAAFDRLSRRTAFPPGVGLPGRVVATGEAAAIPDILDEDNFPRIGSALRAGLRSGLAVPIRRGGRVIGALEVLRRTVEAGDPAFLKRISAVGDQLGLVVDALPARVRCDES